MLLRTIFEETAINRFRKLERSLASSGVDMGAYKRMDTDRLAEEISSLERRERSIIKESSFNSWIKDEKYGTIKLLVEALKALKEHKENRDRAQNLTEGMVYYVAKKRGPVVSGYRCMYLGEGRPASWVPFTESARKLKILEMLRYGTDEDFSTLYFQLADGRPADAPHKFVVEHLTESSEMALQLMEKYCDSRWDGPWPWEVVAPKKLRDMIKENEEMRKARIFEMRSKFTNLYRDLYEGEVEQAEVILKGRETVKQIQGMIEDLGELSADLMTTLKSQITTEYGEAAADGLESAAGEKIGQAVDALSTLKGAIEQELANLESGIGGGEQIPGDDLGGELPPDDEVSDDMVDADIIPDEEVPSEREKK